MYENSGNVMLRRVPVFDSEPQNLLHSTQRLTYKTIAALTHKRFKVSVIEVYSDGLYKKA